MATDETSDDTQAPDTSSALTQAAEAGDANAALLAVSTSASPDDAKKAVIYNCIVTTFHDQGFPTITDQTSRIVWATIDDNVIIFLGDGVTNCITGKGYTCPALAPVFGMLKQRNQVTVVSDLITGIAALVTP